MLIFIGTQQAGADQGIVAARLDGESGALTLLGTAAVVERPTWTLADPVRPILYAVSEVGNKGERMAEVLSFAIEAQDGHLRPISRVSSGGGGATHLALDPRGDRLFVANFGGGEAATIPVASDGTLGAPLSIQTGYGSGPHRRQTGPHAHGVTLDPSRQYLLVPDMGADRIFIYRYDAANGALQPAGPAYATTPTGSGPRLLLFGSDGRQAYLLTELSAEIFAYRWNAIEGNLEEIGQVALDDDVSLDNRSAAAFAMSNDGRFLYASNRRTSMLHVFAIDSQTGLPSEIQQIGCGGDKPWCAEISPGGRWLLVANQDSNTLCSFAIEPGSGLLSATTCKLGVETPTGIAIFVQSNLR
jgi:6-phosphogluconolactonase